MKTFLPIYVRISHHRLDKTKVLAIPLIECFTGLEYFVEVKHNAEGSSRTDIKCQWKFRNISDALWIKSRSAIHSMIFCIRIQSTSVDIIQVPLSQKRRLSWSCTHVKLKTVEQQQCQCYPHTITSDHKHNICNEWMDTKDLLYRC